MPGKMAASYSCPVCSENVTWKSVSVACKKCKKWCHVRRLNNCSKLKSIKHWSKDWQCPNCSPPASATTPPRRSPKAATAKPKHSTSVLKDSSALDEWPANSIEIISSTFDTIVPPVQTRVPSSSDDTLTNPVYAIKSKTTSVPVNSPTTETTVPSSNIDVVSGPVYAIKSKTTSLPVYAVKSVPVFAVKSKVVHFEGSPSSSDTAAEPSTSNITAIPRSDSRNEISNQAKKKSTNRFDCSLCDKSFPIKSRLEKHMFVHTGQRPYQCFICLQSYTKLYLKRHMRTHTLEKPYACPLCPKRFAQSSTRKTHMKTHSEEKPYSCEICNKKFKLKYSVKVHMMQIHQGVKPYRCVYCKKLFSRRSDFNKHLRLHTGEKPFSCDKCKRTFTDSSHCSYHKKRCNGTNVKNED